MELCTNTIKKLSIATVMTFFMTYLISLNIENSFIIFNTKWLSFNFIFTITSGAFVSLLIVLICEYIKYLHLKRNAEIAIVLKLANLFGQILIIKYTCKRALHSHGIANKYLIQSTCNNISIITDDISGIDYTPFFEKSNRIKTILNKYLPKISNSTKTFPKDSYEFQLAITEEELSLLQQHKEEIITYDAAKVRNELICIINKTLPILNDLDIVLSQIDKNCDNRYHWQSVKESLYTYQDNYDSHK